MYLMQKIVHRYSTTRSSEKATADASQIVNQANAAAQAEHDKLMKDARAELAEVALAAASKLLGTTVDAKTNKDMLDAFLAEAGDAR